MPYQRPQARLFASRLTEPRRFVQVVAGPRQVGKSTLVQQVVEASARIGAWNSNGTPERPRSIAESTESVSKRRPRSSAIPWRSRFVIPTIPLVKRVSSHSMCPAPACSWLFLTRDAVDVHA